MYQRDYILRMIEQLGHVLIALRNRILGRQPDAGDAIAEIRAIAAQAGIDLDVARTVDRDTLRLLMSFAGDLDPSRCWLTGELLYLEALHAGGAGNPAARRHNLDRALLLYSWLPPDWTPLPDLPAVSERMGEIRRLADGLQA